MIDNDKSLGAVEVDLAMDSQGGTSCRGLNLS